MKNEKETIKHNAIKALTVIKIYCETANASGYSNEILDILTAEFKPIVDQCERAIKKIEGL